jgi:hypothetical protein
MERERQKHLIWKWKWYWLVKDHAWLFYYLYCISNPQTTCTHFQTFFLKELIKQCTSQVLQASTTNAHPVMFYFFHTQHLQMFCWIKELKNFASKQIKRIQAQCLNLECITTQCCCSERWFYIDNPRYK